MCHFYIRKIEEDLSKELELDIKGAEKPCIWELIGVRVVLLPYTLGKVRGVNFFQLSTDAI